MKVCYVHRFCYPALVVTFIAVFGAVAHFKIGDHSLPHLEVDSWNQFTNETMIIRSSGGSSSDVNADAMSIFN